MPKKKSRVKRGQRFVLSLASAGALASGCAIAEKPAASSAAGSDAVSFPTAGTGFVGTVVRPPGPDASYPPGVMACPNGQCLPDAGPPVRPPDAQVPSGTITCPPNICKDAAAQEDGGADD